MPIGVNDDSACASGMTFEEEPVGAPERSAALDGWVAAFEREMEQTGDFATSVGAMTAHGCFDVHAVVERWILANPTRTMTLAQVQPALREAAPLRLVRDEELVREEELVLEEVPTLEEVAAPLEPALDPELASRKPGAGSAPDIAYFRSLLQGGIERAQIDEAFPGFRLVIDEAVSLHESAEEPILSDVPAPPTREDLNDEIRGMRQKLQESAKRGRPRWRSRD
jgi:hypothetical protein